MPTTTVNNAPGSVSRLQPLSSIGENPPKLEPTPLSTFARPPPDKYATIRTGGKYDKSHKYAQQMEQEEQMANAQQQQQQHQQQHQQSSMGTFDRRQPTGGRRTNPSAGQRGPSEKIGNGTSIVHQPLPEPPTLAPQPLSASHFTQYRSPAPPTLPCCNQNNQQYQQKAQNRTGRTPEKFFSTSSQPQVRAAVDPMRGGSRQAYAHTLDRRHMHISQGNQAAQNVQQMHNVKSGSQTLDRRSRQNSNSRSAPVVPLDSQQNTNDGNKDLYAVTEL